MFELVNVLQELLTPGGRLAFTFIDPNYYSWQSKFSGNNLEWRLQKDNPKGQIGGLL